jgi:hydroxymethylpyrimidine/phosphomethylpyrimidine kinase
MTNRIAVRPTLLVFAGLDPSGAGLQADIETSCALGCHPLPILTANTVQNTRTVKQVLPVDPATLMSQVHTLLEDIDHVSHCKIGLVPNVGVSTMLARILRECLKGAEVFLDPVMRASSAGKLVEDNAFNLLRNELLPLATLIKPNFGEAQALAKNGATPVDWARELTKGRCRYVLLTSADATDGAEISHFLYADAELVREYRTPRYTGQFHGTGCTLTTAIAALRARGLTMEEAVSAALDFTAAAVANAHSIGAAQNIPGRWPVAK